MCTHTRKKIHIPKCTHTRAHIHMDTHMCAHTYTHTLTPPPPTHTHTHLSWSTVWRWSGEQSGQSRHPQGHWTLPLSVRPPKAAGSHRVSAINHTRLLHVTLSLSNTCRKFLCLCNEPSKFIPCYPISVHCLQEVTVCLQ